MDEKASMIAFKGEITVIITSWKRTVACVRLSFVSVMVSTTPEGNVSSFNTVLTCYLLTFFYLLFVF